jgi:hypothetical protein
VTDIISRHENRLFPIYPHLVSGLFVGCGMTAKPTAEPITDITE